VRVGHGLLQIRDRSTPVRASQTHADADGVVIKPSEFTSTTTLALGWLATEAGLSDGVFALCPLSRSTVEVHCRGPLSRSTVESWPLLGRTVRVQYTPLVQVSGGWKSWRWSARESPPRRWTGTSGLARYYDDKFLRTPGRRVARGISSPGSHRTERDSLPSLCSSHPIHQNSVIQTP
jgi:hypothetical protein